MVGLQLAGLNAALGIHDLANGTRTGTIQFAITHKHTISHPLSILDSLLCFGNKVESTTITVIIDTHRVAGFFRVCNQNGKPLANESSVKSAVGLVCELPCCCFYCTLFFIFVRPSIYLEGKNQSAPIFLKSLHGKYNGLII
jgi:hypothetical protein